MKKYKVNDSVTWNLLIDGKVTDCEGYITEIQNEGPDMEVLSLVGKTKTGVRIVDFLYSNDKSLRYLQSN